MVKGCGYAGGIVSSARANKRLKKFIKIKGKRKAVIYFIRQVKQILINKEKCVQGWQNPVLTKGIAGTKWLQKNFLY